MSNTLKSLFYLLYGFAANVFSQENPIKTLKNQVIEVNGFISHLETD